MKPIEVKKLTDKQRKEALAYIMFLKSKTCGQVKARGCLDGRIQWFKFAHHESTSSVVSTDAVFLTGLVDAKEKRVVKTMDVPGAFMQADMPDLVHM